MYAFIDQLCHPRNPAEHFQLFVLAFGCVIVVMNSCQVWYLRRINHLLNAYTYITFLYSNALSDLTVGIGFALEALGSIFIEKNEYTCRAFVEFFDNVLATGSVSISLCTMVAFTIVKVVRVSCNIQASHSTSKKICLAIWTLGFVPFGYSYICNRSNKLTMAVKEKKLIVSCVLLVVLMTVVISYVIVYVKVRRSDQEVNESRFTGPPGSRNHTVNQQANRFKLISSLHILSLIVTIAPVSVYNLTSSLLKTTSEKEKMLSAVEFILRAVASGNSFIDPILFFCVFRPWERNNPPSNSLVINRHRRVFPSNIHHEEPRINDNFHLDGVFSISGPPNLTASSKSSPTSSPIPLEKLKTQHTLSAEDEEKVTEIEFTADTEC